MPYRDVITDAELAIMKVLWSNGASTSPDIFAALKNDVEKSTGTLKTLLHRLVRKGAVRYEKINSRNYLYIPVITEEEFIGTNRRRLIDKVFDGSVNKFLLNFVKAENVTRDDLEQLIKEIEGD